jgi:RNA polymerase subunit RPABC4/transcription elongation factor Spt4
MRPEGLDWVRICGVLAIIAATILLAVAFGSDTSVASRTGERIHNLGLMQQQKNLVTLGTGFLIVGGILGGLGAKTQAESRDMSSGTKKCPECAEMIKHEARICRYCRHRFDREKETAQFATFEAEQSVSGQQAGARTCPACGGIVENDSKCPWCFHRMGDPVATMSQVPAARSFRVMVDSVHPSRVGALIVLVNQMNPARNLIESDLAPQTGGILLGHGLTLEHANRMMMSLHEDGFLPRKEQEIAAST